MEELCSGADEIRYPLLPQADIIKEALYNDSKGILRYSVVTSGRRLTEEEVDEMCKTYRAIKDACGISLCASHGLLTEEQFQKIREAGVTRYHNNLETSRGNISNICTTHTFDELPPHTRDFSRELGGFTCTIKVRMV